MICPLLFGRVEAGVAVGCLAEAEPFDCGVDVGDCDCGGGDGGVGFVVVAFTA